MYFFPRYLRYASISVVHPCPLQYHVSNYYPQKELLPIRNYGGSNGLSATGAGASFSAIFSYFRGGGGATGKFAHISGGWQAILFWGDAPLTHHVLHLLAVLHAVGSPIKGGGEALGPKFWSDTPSRNNTYPLPFIIPDNTGVGLNPNRTILDGSNSALIRPLPRLSSLLFLPIFKKTRKIILRGINFALGI